MSYCSCDVESYPVLFSKTWIKKSRKGCRCSECREQIPPGSSYEYVIGMWDGDLQIFKTCERCADLRDSLVGEDGCFVYGVLQDEYMEFLRDHMEDRDAAYVQYFKVFKGSAA